MSVNWAQLIILVVGTILATLLGRVIIDWLTGKSSQTKKDNEDKRKPISENMIITVRTLFERVEEAIKDMTGIKNELVRLREIQSDMKEQVDNNFMIMSSVKECNTRLETGIGKLVEASAVTNNVLETISQNILRALQGMRG